MARRARRQVDRLQRAAAKLAHENRLLRRVHDALGADVAALFDVDMLQARARWKRGPRPRALNDSLLNRLLRCIFK